MVSIDRHFDLMLEGPIISVLALLSVPDRFLRWIRLPYSPSHYYPSCSHWPWITDIKKLQPRLEFSIWGLTS